MSTFKGVVQEFPDIRIDFFRQNSGARPPLACFLSHVHSDHLVGLDTLKSPFIYCSPATKEILMRLEKYPHRMNFAIGILESRKQTYKHLDKLLKPIPLNTPTKIELAPGNVITVTLFDANHCPGSVMFLIENEEKSILYTGDVRSEPALVSNLRRNPYLIEYTNGLKTLDCIYLDTSHTTDIKFPSKADGLAELLRKVSKYPSDTVFYFSAWTYGYEEVWMALSKALNSQVHVDRYKMRIYKSLVGSQSNGSPTTGPFISHEGPILAGYQCGNAKQDGCLTENPDVRIHSCAKGLDCPIINIDNPKVVWITPIITRTLGGEEIPEAGILAGGGDLTQRPELHLSSVGDIEELLELLGGVDEETQEKLRQILHTGLLSFSMTIRLDDLGLTGLHSDQKDMSLSNFAELVTKSFSKNVDQEKISPNHTSHAPLPRRITFPYARHSSFPELCDFVAAFKPKDVFPCTVNELNWHEGVSMEALFGRYCSESIFRHDSEMRKLDSQRRLREFSFQTHTTSSEEESVGGSSQGIKSSPTNWPVRDARNSIQAVPFHDLPPGEIISRSPGSQSQGLRRKLILEALEEDHVAKRARLDLSGYSPVSPSIRLRPSSPPGSVGHSSNSSRSYSPQLNENDVLIEPNDIEGSSDQSTDQMFYDEADRVYRCGRCGYELQSHYSSYCANCEGEQFEEPYSEDLDSESGQGPEIVHQEDGDESMTEEDRRKYVGEYLDDGSSAFDTLDEEDGFQEDYDQADSFIDDSPTDSTSSESESYWAGVEEDRILRTMNLQVESDSDDEEESWEKKFKNLQEVHEALLLEHDDLLLRHTELLDNHDVLEGLYIDCIIETGWEPSQSEDFDDDGGHSFDEDVDENEVIMVHPVAPTLLAADVVLSPTKSDFRESQISDERMEDGAEEFESVHGDSQEWNELSLSSAENNHMETEIEL